MKKRIDFYVYEKLLGAAKQNSPTKNKNKLGMHFIVIAHGLTLVAHAQTEKSEKNFEHQYVCQELALIILAHGTKENELDDDDNNNSISSGGGNIVVEGKGNSMKAKPVIRREITTNEYRTRRSD